MTLHDDPDAAVRAVAAPVVAAELRAFAARLDETAQRWPWRGPAHNAVRADALAEAARDARARADELHPLSDPTARTTT